MLDLKKIVQLQKELDNAIHQKRQVSYITTFEQRKLALLVEVCELANEVRSFKFWSYKEASPKTVILEEFVDCLHFCISLGIGMEIDFNKCYVSETSSEDKSVVFNETISSIAKLNKDDINTYFEMFSSLIGLSLVLGFSNEEIFSAYLNKNEINHKRQENNY